MAATTLKKSWRTRALSLVVAAATVLTASIIPMSPARADDKPITVGFVYVGSRNDYGYNQAHSEGAAEIAKMPGIKILEQENVPETVQVQKTMETMIRQSGASVIFPTSYGYYDPHMLKVAAKYPAVEFFHCGGNYEKAASAKNVGTYFGYIDECEYISGIAAGKASKSGKLGFIAAIPIPQVLRNINAFTLGAKSVNPNITTTVVFTGGWFDPVKEATATGSLIDQGIDVITMHVDSPKTIVENCEKRGIFCCGYHANDFALAPKGFLTGSEWVWATLYKTYIDDIRAGKEIPHQYRGGLKDGIVKNSPFGPSVTDETKALCEAAKEGFLSGKLVIFKGPLKDNTGKEILAAGASQVQTAPELESMNYLVEGVIGSAGGK